MTVNDKIQKYGPVVLECVSSSQPDKVYEVRCKDGHFSCNCKSWIFNKPTDGGDKRCRHTEEAKRLGISVIRVRTPTNVAYECGREDTTMQNRPTPAQMEMVSQLADKVKTALERQAILRVVGFCREVSYVASVAVEVTETVVRRIVFDD